MDGDRSLEVFATQLVEGRPREGTAREHDVVDAAAGGRRRHGGAKALDDAFDGIAMREVRTHERHRGRRLRCAGAARERHGELLELVRIAGGENDIVTAGDESLGNGDTEPPGRADDQDPSALSVCRHAPRIAETARLRVQTTARRKAGVPGPNRV